ncbi:MAG TPA: hypothetical protein VGX49_06530 [Jatrophihabitans sp.]|jgi:hypothetical protein|nr:hypothetical protein [Jatrophihabitans sp.]
MPNPPWTHPATGLNFEERSFEALLSGAPLPAAAPAGSQFLADVMDALSAPTTGDELAGFATARAAYLTQFGTLPRHGRALRRRPAMPNTLFNPKIATAVAAGVLGLGGLSAAAYAGALPDTAQDVAHHVIGAPATHPGKGAGHAPKQAGTPTSTPVGPDATGPAAFGLCMAYAHGDGEAAGGSVAFTNLATAAGGADKIEAYCATIPHPGKAGASHAVGKPSTLPSHPVGKPSTLPSHPVGPPSSLPSHPTGPPSSLPAHPTGPPSTLPAHPTGKPSTVPAPTSHPTGH